MSFANASSNSANAHFSNKFDVDTCILICILQVMDELREIFNGVNIVMRRWRNKSYARGRMSNFCNPWVDLVTRKLTAFARLCALRHFDLYIIGINEVFTCDSETARSNLFDCRSLGIPIRQCDVARWIFSTLSRIGFRSQSVHRNRQSFVSFL